MAKNRAVILGGTGFVGRHLVDVLYQRGWSLKVLTRNSETGRPLSVYPDLQLDVVDVYDRKALAQAFRGADVVINLVGILNEAGRSGRGFERAHVELTQNVLAAAGEAGVGRLLQMSSLQAGKGSSHYLRTRGAAEALVRKSALHWTLFQPSVIFGPGDGLFGRFAGLLAWVPGVLPLARAGARFQPVFVGDVVEAMARTLERSDSIGQCYELVGPKTYTLKQIVEYTAALLGKRLFVLPLPYPLAKLQALVFDFMPLFLKQFSSDNLKSLELDSISSKQDLARLGIDPVPVERVVPAYFGRTGKQLAFDAFRKGDGESK